MRAIVRGLVKSGALKSSGVALLVQELYEASRQITNENGGLADEGIRGLAGDLETDAARSALRRS